MDSSNKKGTLLYLFGIILFSFGTVLILLFGMIAYQNEATAYKKERLEITRNVAELIEDLMKENPDDFVNYINFYKEHCQDMQISIDNIGYKDDYEDFMSKYTKQYPGKELGKDIMVEDLPYDLQLDYYEYKHEYWLSILEDVRQDMNFMYVYFTVPDETKHDVLYICDVERIPRDGDPSHMMLGDNVFNDPVKFAIEWKTWTTGTQGEFQVLDNEWGHVYTYYDPLVINRQKVGLINIDIKFDLINSKILRNTIELMLKIVLVMIVLIALLLLLIYLVHLKKIITLTAYVKDFSESRSLKIADQIRNNVRGNTELEELALQMADMMESIDRHVKALIDTHKALYAAQHEAETASTLAMKDALTGVRNKLAYDEMCKDIDYKIADGFTDFGIVMIDLNFLKRINDTYGHDKGNIAIKSLCTIVCKTFLHSPVFRIGGDEFVVILENEDFIFHDKKIEEFQNKIKEKSSEEGSPMWERISAAVGVALFDPKIDGNIDNVFKRADTAMYENKKEMKALRDR